MWFSNNLTHMTGATMMDNIRFESWPKEMFQDSIVRFLLPPCGLTIGGHEQKTAPVNDRL